MIDCKYPAECPAGGALSGTIRTREEMMFFSLVLRNAALELICLEAGPGTLGQLSKGHQIQCGIVG